MTMVFTYITYDQQSSFCWAGAVTNFKNGLSSVIKFAAVLRSRVKMMRLCKFASKFIGSDQQF
jgi:hypothetical protein